MRKFYHLISLADMYICDGEILKHRYRGNVNNSIEFNTMIIQDQVKEQSLSVNITNGLKDIEPKIVDRITIISNDKRRIAQIKAACQFYSNLGIKIIVKENLVEG